MTHYDTEEIKDVSVAVNYHWHFGIVIFDLRLLWFLIGLEQNDEGENAKIPDTAFCIACNILFQYRMIDNHSPPQALPCRCHVLSKIVLPISDLMLPKCKAFVAIRNRTEQNRTKTCQFPLFFSRIYRVLRFTTPREIIFPQNLRKLFYLDIDNYYCICQRIPFSKLIFTATGDGACVAALKVSPYFIIVHIIFSGPSGSKSSFCVVSNIQYCLKNC